MLGHVPASRPTVLHVKLEQDDSGFPPYASEELLADSVGDHLYRLDTVPAFALGLARGDVVRVAHYGPEATPWVDDIVEESGHSAVRVISLDGRPMDELKRLCESLGCTTFPTMVDGMMAVDVPPEAHFAQLAKHLDAGCHECKWDYSVGVVGAPHT